MCVDGTHPRRMWAAATGQTHVGQSQCLARQKSRKGTNPFKAQRHKDVWPCKAHRHKTRSEPKAEAWLLVHKAHMVLVMVQETHIIKNYTAKTCTSPATPPQRHADCADRHRTPAYSTRHANSGDRPPDAGIQNACFDTKGHKHCEEPPHTYQPQCADPKQCATATAPNAKIPPPQGTSTRSGYTMSVSQDVLGVRVPMH